jgi:hypothetical protein
MKQALKLSDYDEVTQITRELGFVYLTFAENLHSLDNQYAFYGGNYKKRIFDDNSGLNLRFSSYVVRKLESLVQDCRGLLDDTIEDILKFSQGFWTQNAAEKPKRERKWGKEKKWGHASN